MARHWDRMIPASAWDARLIDGRRGVQLAHGDFTICMREADTLAQLDAVADALQQSLHALEDGQDQCRLRIAAMKGET